MFDDKTARLQMLLIPSLHVIIKPQCGVQPGVRSAIRYVGMPLGHSLKFPIQTSVISHAGGWSVTNNHYYKMCERKHAIHEYKKTCY